MDAQEAQSLLQRAEEAVAATAIEECLALLAQLQQGSDGHGALSPAQRGTALALEAYAKDLISGQDGFCEQYLSQVLEQVRPGTAFLEGLARTLARLGRSREALRLTEDLARRLPGDWRIQADLAELYLVGRKIAAAKQALNRARDLAPVPALYSLGVRLAGMDPEWLLGVPAGRLLAMMDGAPADVCVQAGLQELANGGDPALAVHFLGKSGAGDATTELQLVAAAVSEHPTHGMRYLEGLAAPLRSAGGSGAALAEAALAGRGGRLEECAAYLSKALDVALTEEDESRRQSRVDLLLLCSEVLLSKRDSEDRGERSRELMGDLSRQLLSHGLVTDSVLRLWRNSRSGWAVGSKLWTVRLIVEGVAQCHASDAPGKPRPVGEVAVDFAVAYEVAVRADSEEDAVKAAEGLALELESQLAGRKLSSELLGVESHEPGAIREPLGVLRRSGRIFHLGDGEGSGG